MSRLCWPSSNGTSIFAPRTASTNLDHFGAVKIAAAPLEARIRGGANDDEKVPGA